LRVCRIALGQGFEGDDAALDALSSVDFANLEADKDPILPTYKLHGLGAVGSTLLMSSSTLFKPTQPTITEEDGNAKGVTNDNEDDNDNDNDMDDDDGEEYTVHKNKRTNSMTFSTGVNTRSTARAAVKA